MATTAQSVQCFGKKKTATAVAHCKAGKGLIKVNGRPLGLVEPQILRFKVYEPILILGLDKFGKITSSFSLIYNLWSVKSRDIRFVEIYSKIWVVRKKSRFAKVNQRGGL